MGIGSLNENNVQAALFILVQIRQLSNIFQAIIGEPVFAIVLVYFLLGENMIGLQIIGGSLIMLGVSLFFIRNTSSYSSISYPAALIWRNNFLLKRVQSK